MMDNGNRRRMRQGGGGGAGGGGGGGGGGAGEPTMEAGDWRAQLSLDSRQRLVNKMMYTGKTLLSVSCPDPELKKIAVRFEEIIYTCATSQQDYLRKTSFKFLTMVRKYQNTISNSWPPNPPASSSKAPEPVNMARTKRPMICAACKSKQQKMNEENANSSKNLCDMPDEILHRIMYFLPLRDIVKTSMLSTRWKNLWMSIPDLKFVEDNTMDRTVFMNFVDRFLLLRDWVSTRTFCIDCDVCFDELRINTWITSTLRCSVQSVSILLSKTLDGYPLPYSIFRCSTIRELTIDVVCVLQLPVSTCLPSLRVLALRHITFVDCNTFEKLFSWPSLEKLSIEICSWRDPGVMKISAPNLCSLSIIEDENTYYESDAGNQLIVHGFSLTTFYYSGPLLYRVDLLDLSSLDEATIDCCPKFVHSDEIISEISRNVYDLLMGVSTVKRLNLSARAVQVFDHTSPHGVSSPLPEFINVTTLEFISNPMKLDTSAFTRLLYGFPSLRTLRFVKGFTLDDRGTCDQEPFSPLFFPVENIMVCNVGASGVAKELSAIRLLLSRTHVLKTLVIHCENSRFPSWNAMKKEMLQHINKFLRESTSNNSVGVELF